MAEGGKPHFRAGRPLELYPKPAAGDELSGLFMDRHEHGEVNLKEGMDPDPAPPPSI